MKHFSSRRIALAVAMTLFAVMGITRQIVFQSKGEPIQRKDVQRELKLTPDQVKKVEVEASRFRGDMQSAVASSMPRPGQVNGAVSVDMRSVMQKVNAEHKQRIAAILTASQEKRYKECVLQLQGISAVLEPEIQKALGLTKEQIRDIAEAQSQNRTTFHFSGGTPPSREEMMKTAENNRKKLEAALEKIVTADQKAALKKMAGPTFKKDAD